MNIETLPVHLREIILHYILDETWILNRSYSRPMRRIMRRVCVYTEKMYTILHPQCTYTSMNTVIKKMYSVQYIMNTVEHILSKVLDMLSTCTTFHLNRTIGKAVNICNESCKVLNYFCFFCYLNETEMKQLIIAHEQLHDALTIRNQQEQLWQKFLMDT